MAAQRASPWTEGALVLHEGERWSLFVIVSCCKGTNGHSEYRHPQRDSSALGTPMKVELFGLRLEPPVRLYLSSVGKLGSASSHLLLSSFLRC